MSKIYQNSLWKEFRQSVIELDGNKCSICGRSGQDVVLQVHHTKYISGYKPWEYATKYCVVLCQGCHAAEHGKIMPKHGWEYISDEDLGGLYGTCDNCNRELRYAFYIFHEKWGTITVGTSCCDNLTDTDIASNLVESKRRFEGRMERFCKSKKWEINNEKHCTKQSNFEVEINNKESSYFITIKAGETPLPKSTKEYHSLSDAKRKIFEIIEDGSLIEYCKKHNIKLRKEKKQRKSE